MKRLTAIIISLALITGCAGIQFKTPQARQIAELAVSIGSKALGLKLVDQGFIWTPEIETFYKIVIEGDGLTLDTAQIAENYINEHVDPLLAPDIIKLSKLVGVEFGPDGNILDVSGVDPQLIRIAAEGIRLAVTTRQKMAWIDPVIIPNYDNDENYGITLLPATDMHYSIRKAVEDAARATDARFGMNWKNEAEKRQWMIDRGFLLSDEQMRAILPRIQN